MRKTLLLNGIGAAVLLLAVGYAAVYALDWASEARGSSVRASWAYNFADLPAMAEPADAIVLAQVVDVSAGRIAGGAAHQIGFTNVRLQVLEDWSRESLSSDEVVVELTGGSGTPFFKENPLYRRGETYLLFLRKQQVEPYLYIIGNPQARYLVRDGSLEAMPYDGPITREWDGRPVEELRQAVYDARSAGS